MWEVVIVGIGRWWTKNDRGGQKTSKVDRKGGQKT